MSASTATSTQTQAATIAPANTNATSQVQPEGAPKPRKKIVIRRLPYETTRLEIEELCSSYGRVTNVEVRRGYGLVTFESEEDAEYAIYRLKDKVWHGTIALSADYANDKPQQSNKQGAPVKREEKEHKKRKIPEQSLKYLTPKNPATTNPTNPARPSPAPTSAAPAPVPASNAPSAISGSNGPAPQQGEPRRNRGGGRGGPGGRGGRGGRGGPGGPGGRGRDGGRGGRGGRSNSNYSGYNNNNNANNNQNNNNYANNYNNAGKNFSSNSDNAPASHPVPQVASTAVAPSQQTPPNSNNSSRRGNNRKTRPGKGNTKNGSGALYEITVKNLDSGAVTHTLHMTEGEVQQYILPLTKDKLPAKN